MFSVMLCFAARTPCSDPMHMVTTNFVLVIFLCGVSYATRDSVMGEGEGVGGGGGVKKSITTW